MLLGLLGVWSQIGVNLHEECYEVDGLSGDALPRLAAEVVLPGNDLAQHRREVPIRSKRSSSGQHHVGDAAEGPNVDFRAVEGLALVT